MSRIELITALPDWKWKENSEREIILTGKELLDQSDFIWRVGNVAVAGFIYTSYASPPWMWFVLADNVKVADLIDFRRLALQIPKGTLTAVADDFPVAMKFAKIYNFVLTGDEVVNSGRTYKILRKI